MEETFVCIIRIRKAAYFPFYNIMQIPNVLYAFELLQGEIFPSNFKLDKRGQLYCPRELCEAKSVSNTCIYKYIWFIVLYLKTPTTKHETNRTKIKIKMPIKEFIIKIMHSCEKRITFKNATLIYFLKKPRRFQVFWWKYYFSISFFEVI